MVTEPLTPEQLASIGWANRQGLSRHPQPVPLLPPHRGQPDPVGRLRRHLLLARQGVDASWRAARDVGQAEPALLRDLPAARRRAFSHIWGGVIDTCSRFCVFWGTAMSGRVAYALGYTGLGVASTRFGAEVMLDLLDGRRTIATSTDFVQGTSRCRSRRSRSASPASRRPGGRSTARTAPASATCGCVRSTAWASGSTPEPAGTVAGHEPALVHHGRSTAPTPAPSPIGGRRPSAGRRSTTPTRRWC